MPPDPAQLGDDAPRPRRFDESLDELVRQGVVKPEEAELIRRNRGGAPEPLDVGALQRACRSGALSPDECKMLKIHWGRLRTAPAGRSTTTGRTTPPAARPQGSPARPAGVVLISDCLHTPFKPQGEGQLVSTYSCANSDVVGYSIAVDCPRQLVNLHAPGGPLGVDDTYRWRGWEKPGDAHQRAAMDAACAPLFKAASKGGR